MKRDIPRCAFGSPIWTHRRCVGCAKEVKRLQLEFRIAVFEGRMDAAGYTPAERRAQQKRKVD